MRKIFVIFLVFVSFLFAKDIQIHKGWNLVGATNELNPTEIPSANSVWVFRDNSWTLYNKNAPSDNYGFDRLSSIQAGEGFWVDATSDDTIHIVDVFPVSKIYQAYGLCLMDRKKDARYTVSNIYGANNVEYNADNSTFMLNAYKNPHEDSRAELSVTNLWAYSITSAEAAITLNIDGNDTIGFRNRAQLNLCSMPITQSKDASGCTGIVVGSSGAFFWYEKDYFSGQYIGITGKQFAQENMVGKNITMKISLNGSQITYSISGDINHEITFDTAETNATITGEARSLTVRSRVKGNNSDVDPDAIGDATHVLVKNIAITYK